MKSIFGGQISYIDLKSKRFYDALIESYSKSKEVDYLQLRQTSDGQFFEYQTYDKSGVKVKTTQIKSPNDLNMALDQYFQVNPTISDQRRRYVKNRIKKVFQNKDIGLTEGIRSSFINSLNTILGSIGLKAQSVVQSSTTNQATNSPQANNRTYSTTLANSGSTTTTPKEQLEELINNKGYLYIGPEVFKVLSTTNLTKYPNIFTDLKTQQDKIFKKNIDNRYIFKVEQLSDTANGELFLVVKPIFVRYNVKNSILDAKLGGSRKFNTQFSFLKVQLKFINEGLLNSVWNNQNPKFTIRPINDQYVSLLLKDLFATNHSSAETAMWITSWFKDPQLKVLYNQDKTVQKLARSVDRTIDSFNTNIGGKLDSILQKKNQKEKKVIITFSDQPDFDSFIGMLIPGSSDRIFLNTDGSGRAGVYLKNKSQTIKNPYIIINTPYAVKEDKFIKFYVENNLIEIPDSGAGTKTFDEIKFNTTPVKTKIAGTNTNKPITLNNVISIQ